MIWRLSHTRKSSLSASVVSRLHDRRAKSLNKAAPTSKKFEAPVATKSRMCCRKVEGPQGTLVSICPLST